MNQIDWGVVGKANFSISGEGIEMLSITFTQVATVGDRGRLPTQLSQGLDFVTERLVELLPIACER